MQILSSIQTEQRRLLIAGALLGKGDDRIARFITELTPYAEQTPVFAKLQSYLKAVHETGDSTQLLQSIALLRAIQVTQVPSSTEGEIIKLEVKGIDAHTTAKKSEIEPIIDAFRHIRSGRFGKVADVMQAGIITEDLRFASLLPLIIRDKYSSFTPMYIVKMIAPFGDGYFDVLATHISMNPGTQRDVQLLTAIYKAWPEKTIPLFHKILTAEKVLPDLAARALALLFEVSKNVEAIKPYENHPNAAVKKMYSRLTEKKPNFLQRIFKK